MAARRMRGPAQAARRLERGGVLVGRGLSRLHGEVERAHQTFLALGDKLAAAKQWEPLAAVIERALEVEETQAAARLLVKAHEGLGPRSGAPRRARARVGDDAGRSRSRPIVRGAARRVGPRRSPSRAARPAAAALRGRGAQRRGSRRSRSSSSSTRTSTALVRLIQTLPSIRGDAALRETQTLLDIAFPRVAEAGRAGEGLEALRAVATNARGSARTARHRALSRRDRRGLPPGALRASCRKRPRCSPPHGSTIGPSRCCPRSSASTPSPRCRRGARCSTLLRRRPHRDRRRRDGGDRLRARARPPHALRRRASHAEPDRRRRPAPVGRD